MGDIYGNGIKLTSGFDLGSKIPLDSRTIVNTIADRDAHAINNRAYIGMKVYVIKENKEYMYIGNNKWKELNIDGAIKYNEHQTLSDNEKYTARVNMDAAGLDNIINTALIVDNNGGLKSSINSATISNKFKNGTKFVACIFSESLGLYIDMMRFIGIDNINNLAKFKGFDTENGILYEYIFLIDKDGTVTYKKSIASCIKTEIGCKDQFLVSDGVGGITLKKIYNSEEVSY